MPEQTHGEGASEPSETSDRSGSTAQSESGPESLRRTAIRASALEGLGFVSSQALRLVGNLVATRLLFPEAFGLATLVNVTTTGLILLSDVGIQQSVIQNPRGEDRDFLDTAWTIQVVRGLILGALAAAFAWPFSWLYAEPILAPMMLVAAAQLVVSGFDSMSLFTLRRRVRLGWVVGVDVGSQATAVVVMLLWASVEPSVWALVAGAATKVVVQTPITHLIPAAERHRFRWDESAAREIRSFGRWIFGSSAMHFIASQGDRLMLGRLMGATTLGVYSIAVYVSETVGSLTIRIVHGVFYPVFSRVVREDRASLARIYYKTRLRLDLLAMPALGGLSVLGPWVIDLLWDDRYRGAGWMLQLLTARVALSVWATPCQTCLVALGQPRHAFARTVARMVSVLIGVPTGYALGGVEGLVLAVALSEVPGLFVLLPPFAREGLLRPTRELIAPLMFGLGAGVAALLDPWLPRW